MASVALGLVMSRQRNVGQQSRIRSVKHWDGTGLVLLRREAGIVIVVALWGAVRSILVRFGDLTLITETP